MPDIGSSLPVVVETPFIPIGLADSVQINVVHDDSMFTIQNAQCGSMYSGGFVFGPVRAVAGAGTVIGCGLNGGPSSNSGPVITFDLVRLVNGGADITLETGAPQGTGFIHAGDPIPNGTHGALRIFGATITGSFELQAVSDPTELANIAHSASAIPVNGPATMESSVQYDPAIGTFTIVVNAPGDYDVQANATGFISRKFAGLNVLTDSSANAVPSSTSLRGGDVNGDGAVNAGDVSDWIPSFGTTTPDRTDGGLNIVDIDGDGFVMARDLSILITNIGLAPAGGVEDWGAP